MLVVLIVVQTCSSLCGLIHKCWVRCDGTFKARTLNLCVVQCCDGERLFSELLLFVSHGYLNMLPEGERQEQNNLYLEVLHCASWC